MTLGECWKAAEDFASKNGWTILVSGFAADVAAALPVDRPTSLALLSGRSANISPGQPSWDGQTYTNGNCVSSGTKT